MANLVAQDREIFKVLVVICLSAFLFFNSYGSINVAVPSIQSYFGVGLAAVQWVAIIGLVMVSSFSLCFGKAGDLLGRKKLFRIGVVMYTLGSGLAALSPSFPILLICRAVMTLGLSMAGPMSAGILAVTFPAERRGEVLGWLAASIAVGRASGPAVGGLILQFWGWRGIFLINLIIGLIVSAAVLKVFGGKEERRAESFDYIGAATLIIGYPSLLIALSLGTDTGWSSPQILIWFALFALGSIGFLATESRTETPLIQPAFFKSLLLSSTVISLALISAAHYPIYVLAPLFMQNILNLSPFALGLAATTLPVCTAVVSPLGGRLADWMDSFLLGALGVCLTLIGIGLYSLVGVASHYLSVIVALSLIGAGIGFYIPAYQRTAFSMVGKEHYGVISAMFVSISLAAGTVGTTASIALLQGMLRVEGIGSPGAFANAQQYAFSLLLPFGVLALLVSLVGKLMESKKDMKNGNH